MRRKLGLVMGLALAASSLVWAEEGADAAEDQARPTTHKVLQDPHQISSFYRSQQQSSPFFEEYGDEQAYGHDDQSRDDYAIAGYYRQGGGSDRYSIASFYRNEGSSRYPIASFYRNEGPSGRYPVAGFYRQGGHGRYAGFWNVPVASGHGYRYAGYRRVRTRELCFVAPTVLFPFVPVVDDMR